MAALHVSSPVKTKPYKTLRLILGDQLDPNHSWFSDCDPSILYVIAELHQETGYVDHHVQKVCAFFLAMQAFATGLTSSGHDVLYLTLDDTAADRSLQDLIMRLGEQYQIETFDYQLPDEYRLMQQLSNLSLPGVTIKAVDSEHFIIPREALSGYFKANKKHQMEAFYRKMRLQHRVLMEGDKPLGGQWNFDKENRSRLKPQDLSGIPEPLVFGHDVSEILERVHRHAIKVIGYEPTTLLWPITREESLALLQHFCRHLLIKYGHFQDAMTDQSEHQWSLYHSRLSFSLNLKMLNPKEVIDAAISAFNGREDISIAQVEGFVRQILGWREFVRGMYWLNMPNYSELNYLEADRPLPGYFWNGATKMNCMAKTIDQSLQFGFAHHIQRLMITGTFSLLTGINPDQVDQWYLGIYVDALEWVELPNTRGMSQFADGGLIATKPYSASGNYINKMSDYCKSCHYKVANKVEDDACPFNSLYWHFMERHRDRFERNPRIGMVYRNWDKQIPEQRKRTIDRGQWCLDHIEEL
ncbi:MAG: deoxyribodipyrimidine photolyase-related protein [Candidatus Azotimanducaceae bacterium]|jgi:deoxyribodipyrimidine photolyase-related protein